MFQTIPIYLGFSVKKDSVSDPDLHGSALIWLSWIRIWIHIGMRIRIQEQGIDQNLQIMLILKLLKWLLYRRSTVPYGMFYDI